MESVFRFAMDKPTSFLKEGKMEVKNKSSNLGLIFRLNCLWANVDTSVIKGDYNEWNILLNQIYTNLSYKGKTIFLKDTKGKIRSVFSDTDGEEYKYGYKFLSEKVNLVGHLNLKGVTKGISNKKIVRRLWYEALYDKDVWLRRFMHKFNLYIKETDVGCYDTIGDIKSRRTTSKRIKK